MSCSQTTSSHPLYRLRRLVHVCTLTWRRHHERRRLPELDERTLADMGLTREQALRIANRWFWQGL